MSKPLDDFKQFVNDAQASDYYKKTWARDNPGELSRWTAFRDSILAGHSPPKPTMTTKYGASLIDAGMTYLDSRVIIIVSGDLKIGSKLTATISLV